MVSTDIDRAADDLRQGKVVAIPTETVYGLAANAWNEQAVQQIFSLKQRPLHNPLIVHIASMARLKEVTTAIPSKALQLAERFWPGPLTLVLPKSFTIPGIVTANKQTVAVRIPDHPIALELLGSLTFPLAAPSANPFGKISPTSAAHVEGYFQKNIPILDGGPCNRGIESTIVGFENKEAVIYRLGSLPIEAIEDCIGRVQIKQVQKEVKAPGMLTAHYAPATPCILTDDVPKMIEKYKGQTIAVLFFQKSIDLSASIDFEILSEQGDMEEASRNLYATMHRLDQCGADIIVMERLPDTSSGKAINDRLTRAAATFLSHQPVKRISVF